MAQSQDYSASIKLTVDYQPIIKMDKEINKCLRFRNQNQRLLEKNVPLHTKLKLFSKSAGRCQFRGCNKLIWRNDLTLTERNFGEVAHIIAASASGPRGNQESKKFAN